MSCCIASLVYSSLKAFENEIFSLFETGHILDRLLKDWNVVLISLILYAGVISFGGAIRGIGQQGLASINYFIAYFCIGIPFSAYLVFCVGTHEEQ